jgi:hypothetical protein
MDASRLRTGELIAGVAGALLFIVMFFGWFGISVEDVTGLSQDELTDLAEAFPDAEAEGDSVSFSAWESLSFIDIILAITALVAIGLAVATAAARAVSLPVAASALTAGLGILSTLLILYRIIDPPYALNREFWVFVGLVLAAAIAYGGWRSMQEEGTTFGGEADRLQDRVSGDRTPPPPPPPPPGTGPGTGTGTGTGAPPPPPPSGPTA